MRLQIFVRLTEYGDDAQPAPFFMDTQTTSWKRLRHLVKVFAEYYGNAFVHDVRVWYWDEEDMVIVSSQEELDEACRLAEEGGRSFLQFYVQKVVKCALHSNNQQPAADSSRATAAVDHFKGKQERKGTGEEHPERSMWGNSRPSVQPKAKRSSGCIFKYIARQQNNLADAMNNGTEEGLDLQEKAQEEKVSRSAGEAASSLSDSGHAQLLRKTMTDDYDEGRTQEQSDEDESADLGHSMLPGALSGANVIAIEMPEMEHQGTESAEPAEIAETGEVTTKSSRDAETGFWMQPQLEAEVKAELRRKVSTMVEKQQASSDRPQQKKHERKACRADCPNKKKKHRGGESVSEESAGDLMIKGKSSTSNTSNNPQDVVSEVASNSTPCPHKKHKHKPSKSEAEGDKKTHFTEPLTRGSFMRYMLELVPQMKKDIAKAVARKTVRGVLKNLPEQGEGSETPARTPVIPSQRTDYPHEDIICDSCDRQIFGTRYICGNCPNYDLCEECESIQPSFHDCSHVFIKMRRPYEKAGTRHGMRVPLLKHIIYDDEDQEREEDPDRIHVIQEHAEGQESPAEGDVSRNSNNEEEEEGGLSEPPFQDEQEEEYQTLENSERMYDVKASEVADSEAETLGQMMENAEPLYRTIYTGNGDMMSVPHPELVAFDDKPPMFFPTQLLRHIIAVHPIPEKFTIHGHPGVYHFEKRTCEGRAPYEVEVQYFFKTQESANEYADCQPTIFHATELMMHVISTNVFPPAFVVRGIPDLPYKTSTVQEASKVTYPDWWTGQTREQRSEAADDEKDDDLGPEEDLYPECVEDDFVVCSPTQGSSEEQVTGERSTSPASSIEVVKLAHSDVCSEPVTGSQEITTVKDETGVRIHQSTQYQTDDVVSLGSLTDDSSSDEDFVVVPDCFDTSKPLDPLSLQRLSREKMNKGRTLENKSDEGRREFDTYVKGIQELGYTHEFIRRRLEKELGEETSSTPWKTSRDEIVHVLPQTEGEDRSCTPCNHLEILDQNPDDHLHLAEEEPDSSKETLDAFSYFGSLGRPERKTEEAEEQAVAEEAEEQAVGEEAEEQAVTEEAEEQAVTEEAEEQAVTEEAEEQAITEEAEEQAITEEAEFEEEGAAAADPDSLDPERQLNDIVTSTFKKASSGLQQLYQTGKDIFKNLQRGDSYEPEESTYVFKPADYKLPESTWRPSNKEFVMPKSNFKLVEKEFHMPKTTYSGPQTQAPSAGVYSGEFSGPLQRIREMGYFNNERTLALLRKYEGDVEKVVNELIEETDSDWADRRHGNNA